MSQEVETALGLDEQDGFSHFPHESPDRELDFLHSAQTICPGRPKIQHHDRFADLQGAFEDTVGSG